MKLQSKFLSLLHNRIWHNYMVERCIHIYIYFINYIENYMFRRLIMAIFRLYMNHLVSSYTNIYTYIYIYTQTYIYIYIYTHTYIYIYIYIYIYTGYLYGEGGKVGTRSRICQNGWDVWDAWRVHVVLTDTRSRAHFTPPPFLI